MNICILLVNFDHFGGCVRPFYNWSKALKELKKEDKFSLVSVGSDKSILQRFRGIGIETYSLANFSHALSFLKKRKPDLIFSDDSLDNLNFLIKIKKNLPKLRTAVYVQTLYGSHLISNVFSSFNLEKKNTKALIYDLIPSKMITQRFTKLLSPQDYLIPNSYTTSTLLFSIYGVFPSNIVFPPLDITIFDYNKLSKKSKKEQVIIYSGSYTDTPFPFIEDIIKRIYVKNKRMKIKVFGSREFYSYANPKIRKLFEFISGISDKMLSQEYYFSRLTIAPQLWELFGYVPIESMAMGTPVIAFNIMGLTETIIPNKTGALSRSYKELLENIDEYIKTKRNEKHKEMVDYIRNKFSSQVSLSSLLKIFTGDSYAK